MIVNFVLKQLMIVGVLLLLVENIKAQLPTIQFPQDNLSNSEKVDLGYRLFFDKRLSADNSISCSTCHQPSRGWTDNRQIARGINNQRGTRNSPTIINIAYATSLFRDGRAVTLEGQSLPPITSPTELGMPSINALLIKLSKTDYYPKAFAKAFPNQPTITQTNLAKAIATFERSIISFNTPYDQYIQGDVSALTQRQINGLNLFNTNCANCHIPPLLTDNSFHNTGTSPNLEEDQGRFTITQVQSDFKAFRTPQLREVARTNPYMHNGFLPTLRSVILFYNRSRSLNLTQTQVIELEDFLKFGLLSTDVPNLPEPVQYK